MSIEIISPEEKGYKRVEEAVEQSYRRTGSGGSRAFYNDLAVTYNSATVGSYLDIGKPTQSLCNLRKVLVGRGLRTPRDFEVVRLTRDANNVAIPKQHRTMVLKKLSKTQMRVLP